MLQVWESPAHRVVAGLGWWLGVGMLDWNAITAVATFATAVATAVSVALVLLFRAFDQERVEWIWFDGRSAWRKGDVYSGDAEPHCSAELANVGRGAALAVRARGVGCRAMMFGEYNGRYRPELSLRTSMTPGEQVQVMVWCEPDAWEQAQVAITWKRQVGLSRRRRHISLVPLRSIAEPPHLTLTGTDADGVYREEEADPGPGPHLSGRREDLPAPPQRRRFLARAKWQRAIRQA